MRFLNSLTSRLGPVLALYGGWGLFGVSFLDSSFLSFPLVNDLLLIHLAGQNPGRALVYALASAVGSVLGALAIFALARGGGGILWRRRSPQRAGRIDHWLGRNGFLALLLVALLPPPVPFKPFVVGAGVLRVKVSRFVLALLVGRSLRFSAVAVLGAWYGARAESYFRANLGRASLIGAGLVLLFVFFYRMVSRSLRPAPSGQELGKDSSSSQDSDGAKPQ